LCRKNHQQLWPAAIAAIEKGKPSLMVDRAGRMPEELEVLAPYHGLWTVAHQAGLIDDEQYNRFQQAVETLYERTEVEGMSVYTLKKDPRSRAKP
jgi:hypothetical protein